MRAYKVKTYDELERDIDMYCIVFGCVCCLVYVGVLITTSYLAISYAH